jgi:hypothetical protein
MEALRRYKVPSMEDIKIHCRGRTVNIMIECNAFNNPNDRSSRDLSGDSARRSCLEGFYGAFF